MIRIRPVLFALAALMLAAGCRVNRPPNDHAATQTLYDSMSSDPGTFNPLLVTDSASNAAIGDLFESLVRINPQTLLPEPGLAASWDLGDGGKTITFHLRHGVVWSDGVPFTSRDVIFTMRTIYNPKVPNSTVSSMLIDGQPIAVAAPDDYTVVMRLPRPFAPLFYSVGFPIIPAHILEPDVASGAFIHTWGIDTPPDKLVSDGAYLMTRYVPAQQLAYRRNPAYWMRDESGGELPRLRGQVRLIVPDQNAQYLRFMAGITDVYSPRPEEVNGLRENAARLHITVKDVGIDTGSLFFVFNRNPRHYVAGSVTNPKYKWFTDPNFMRALAHSIDKQGIINLCFRGLAVPAISDTSPENRIFYNPNLTPYDYDLNLAARILDEAGYRMLRPGVRGDPGGHPLIFNLTTNTGVPVRDQMCAIFKQDLATLGIQVNYRPLEFISLVKALESSFDWDCVLIGFGGTIEPNDASNFLRSSGNLHVWNPSQPKPATPWEAEIDSLMDQGTTVMDERQRAPFYWRIQRILHDELPIIETVRQVEYIAYRNTIVGYNPTVWGLYKPEWMEFRAQ
ncbi:MAG TPA: ABC transporter substrate-binding protein [Candidatus Binataceae bacterium]|nr:ABC transporter substrate-binding protein [Candidatus Binataceae bacterium]